MKHAVRVIPFAVLAAFAVGCSTQPSSDSSSSQPASSSSPSGQAAGSQSVAGNPMNDPKSAAVVAKRSIYYDFDKYDLKPESRALIEAHARYLREHPDVKVRIEGNADERGSAEYNL